MRVLSHARARACVCVAAKYSMVYCVHVRTPPARWRLCYMRGSGTLVSSVYTCVRVRAHMCVHLRVVV